MSEPNPKTKKLIELTLVELRNKLEQRDLRGTGNKSALLERLRQAITDEGGNPDTIEFEIEEDQFERLTKALTKKIDESHQKTNEGMDLLKEEMKGKLEEMRATVDRVETEVQKVKNELHAELKETLITEVEQKTTIAVNQIEGRVSNIVTQTQEAQHEANRRLTALENGLQRVLCGGVATTAICRMKTPEFDGSIPWAVYKEQFDAVAERNRWSPEEKATELKVALKGKAANMIRITPNPNSFASLVETLEQRYGDLQQRGLYQTQLRTRRQKADENLRDLKEDLEQLARVAYPGAPSDVLDHITTDALIEAVRDPRLRQSLRLSGKQKPNDVLQHALTYEASEEQKPTSHVRTLEAENETEDRLLRVIEGLEGITKSIAETSSNRRRQLPSDRRCWNCDQVGHLRRECRKPSRIQDQTPRATGSELPTSRRTFGQSQGGNLQREHRRPQEN